MVASAVLTLEVLPVADDRVMRAGLAAMVLQSGRLLTVAPGVSRNGITSALARGSVHALLWDAGIDALGALEAISRHAAQWPPVLLLTTDAGLARDAVAAGARAVMGREATPVMLGLALEAVINGLSVFDQSVMGVLAPARTRPDAPPVEPLTSREREVLALLAEGLSNKSIADALHISEHTAKFHVNAVMAKLGVQKRTEAVTRAVRLGLIIL